MSTFTFFSPLFLVLLLSSYASALSIDIPNANTKWGRTASIDTISWTASPLPASPATTVMNIRILNSSPNLYSPLLDVQFQAGIDFTQKSSLQFLLSNQLAEGSGYQIIFVSPSDPTIIYAKSALFSIVADAQAVNGASTSAVIIESINTSAASRGTSSTLAPTAIKGTANNPSSTAMSTGKGATPTTAKGALATPTGLQANVAPGGPGEQGLQFAYLSAGSSNFVPRSLIGLGGLISIVWVLLS